MDMTPTGKMPFDPPILAPPPPSTALPTLPSTLPPTVQALDPTGRVPLAFDATADQPTSAIVTRRFPGSRFFSEIAFQNLRSNLATVGLALLLAAPIAGLVFFAIASVRFAFDDRTFANSQSHSLAEFWYILLLFMIALAPVTFVLLRRSYDAAVGFVVDRGYWKVLLAVYVLFPLAAGIVAFVVGHFIAVLVVVALLLIVLSITGGF